MKELYYYIQDVRLATDNTDENGVKDREIIRYFNDGIKSIQALVFKNNPLCSYFQATSEQEPSSTREYTLPTDCFAENAVTMVEVGESTLERVWPEDGTFGWYTRGKKVILTFDAQETVKIHYFQRLPKVGLKTARVTEVQTFEVQTFEDYTAKQAELPLIDSRFSIVKYDGEIAQTGLIFQSFPSGTSMYFDNVLVPATAEMLAMNFGISINRYYLVWGYNTTFIIDLPEEVEPYLVDYVAKRIYGRNNYAMDGSKISLFTDEEKANIIAIFGDAGQSVTRTPLTDTDFMAV